MSHPVVEFQRFCHLSLTEAASSHFKSNIWGIGRRLLSGLLVVPLLSIGSR